MATKLVGSINTQVGATPAGIVDSVFNNLAVNDTAAHPGQTWTTDQVHLFGGSFQWTGGAGTPAGTAIIQESCDGGTTWTTCVAVAGEIVSVTVTGNAGAGIFKLVDRIGTQFRVSLTLTAGSANFTFYAVGKGF